MHKNTIEDFQIDARRVIESSLNRESVVTPLRRTYNERPLMMLDETILTYMHESICESCNEGWRNCDTAWEKYLASLNV